MRAFPSLFVSFFLQIGSRVLPYMVAAALPEVHIFTTSTQTSIYTCIYTPVRVVHIIIEHYNRKRRFTPHVIDLECIKFCLN